MAHSGYSDIANLSRVGAGRRKGDTHEKTPTVLLAAATIAVSLATFATDASAQRRGGAVAAGIDNNLINKLIIKNAITNSNTTYSETNCVVTTETR